MKAVVVYFSLEGNTEYVAKQIAKELNADVIPLIPKKEYPTGKVSKFIWGGKSVTFKETPRLETYQFDVDNYDLILLGTPIWASTFVPPLRTFLRDNKLVNKKVAFFASCSGGSADKCFLQMENEISDCTVLSTLRLIDPLENFKQEDSIKITEFCTKLKLDLEK